MKSSNRCTCKRSPGALVLLDRHINSQSLRNADFYKRQVNAK